MRTARSLPGGAATDTPPADLSRPSSNNLPPPLLSSRARRWSGIVVELRCSSNVDVVLPYPDHVITVIVSGKAALWQSRGGRIAQCTMRPGQVVITPAGGPKRWQHVDDLVAVVLRLSRAYLDKLAAEMDEHGAGGGALSDVFSVCDPFLQDTGMRLLKALEPQSKASDAHVDALVRSLGLHLLSRYTVERSHFAPYLSTMPPKKLRRAVDYIEANLHRGLTISHIARHLTMSESHFSHVFRQTVGVPPHRYIRDRRVERAKTLLRACDMPLTDIAHKVGFSSASNFSVLFHRATGTTPNSYRNGC